MDNTAQVQSIDSIVPQVQPQNPEIKPIIETKVENQSPEIVETQQGLPTQQDDQDDNTKENKETKTEKKVIPEEIPNVTDKSDEELVLHDLGDVKDKITSLADEEEEEFIKNVEAAHEQH